MITEVILCLPLHYHVIHASFFIYLNLSESTFIYPYSTLTALFPISLATYFSLQIKSPRVSYIFFPLSAYSFLFFADSLIYKHVLPFYALYTLPLSAHSIFMDDLNHQQGFNANLIAIFCIDFHQWMLFLQMNANYSF